MERTHGKKGANLLPLNSNLFCEGGESWDFFDPDWLILHLGREFEADWEFESDQ